MVIRAGIDDIFKGLLLPIFESAFVPVFGQSIKNMVQAIESGWDVDQPKRFTMLAI